MAILGITIILIITGLIIWILTAWTFSMKALLQHQKAVSISGSRHEKLKTLHIPALVIHGTEDQFFPFEHGKKLVESLPDKKGIWLDGVGHVFPFPKMNEVMEEVIRHFSV